MNHQGNIYDIIYVPGSENDKLQVKQKRALPSTSVSLVSVSMTLRLICQTTFLGYAMLVSPCIDPRDILQGCTISIRGPVLRTYNVVYVTVIHSCMMIQQPALLRRPVARRTREKKKTIYFDEHNGSATYQLDQRFLPRVK